MLRLRIILLIILTILLVLANIFFGAVELAPGEVWTALTTSNISNDVVSYIVVESRLPQALTAMLAGGALAVSGLLLQTLFRNPLAGPSILGITSGASLGVALVILFMGGMLSFGGTNFGGNMAITIGGLTGSFAVLLLLSVLSTRIRNNLTLLIVGMMIGYMSSSIVTLLSSVSTARNIQSFVMWGMGTFSNVSLQRLPYFGSLIIIGLLLSMLLAKPLNLLLLGDNYAANLGVNVHRTRNLLLLTTGLLAATVTAYCGPIGFIGLAMPHIARMIFRTDDHFILLPATMLCGALLALICNLLSILPSGIVIPINALTPIAGVPVVLYVILKGAKK